MKITREDSICSCHEVYTVVLSKEDIEKSLLWRHFDHKRTTMSRFLYQLASLASHLEDEPGRGYDPAKQATS